MAPKNSECPLCQATNPQVVYDLSDVRTPLTVPGQIARCRSCGMWFKITTPDAVREAYSDDYADKDGLEQYMLSEPTRAFFRKVLGGVEIKRGAIQPRLLDIGTGLGALLEEAGKLGYEAEGVDLCEALVRKAQSRGLRVHCKPAQELSADEPFDVVTMMDVIEHVTDLVKLLRAARRVMKPDGELIVYTPNHRSAVVLLAKLLHVARMDFALVEIFGSNHVCFFDSRSLSAALHKVNLSVRKLKRFPYNPSRPGQYVSPVSLLAVSTVEQLGRPFGRVFRMIAYARPNL